MNKISIIIPNFNGYAVLRECIASIRKHTSLPYEIIVIDNGSHDESVNLCFAEKVCFVSLPTNRGFPAACNLGLSIASYDTLVLLNNDTMVTAGWLENMLRVLNSRDVIGIVGPMTNYSSGSQQMEEPFTDVENMASWLKERNDGKQREVKRLVGFCLMFKRSLVEKIGMLDERFAPGHFEDDDFCYRARQAGYKLMIASDVFIFHYGSASFQKEDPSRVRLLLETNRRKFMDKWGVDPHQFIE